MQATSLLKRVLYQLMIYVVTFWQAASPVRTLLFSIIYARQSSDKHSIAAPGF